jgi:hypothetical protein
MILFYLDVPYSEKDEAKKLGARWDPKAKSWYVPKGHSTHGLWPRWRKEPGRVPPSAPIKKP